MYRIEKVETGGRKKILLVLQEGRGIKDFKILEVGDDFIKIGYTSLPVNTMYRKEYIPGTFKMKVIEQTYYFLDVKKKKIFRVGRIGGKVRIDNGIIARKLYLGIYPGTDITIRMTRNYHYVKACITDKKGLKPYSTDLTYIDPESKPGTIKVLFFNRRGVIVHDVSYAVFLK